MSGWREMSLGELGRIVTGKTPSTSFAEFFGGDVPFVTPSDMYGHKVISRTERFLTKAGVAAVKGSFIPKGSVMVSCIGSDMGKVTIAAHDCVSNQQINSIVVSKDFSPDFIYYNLSTRKAELQSLACSGSAQPILNKGHFSQLPIVVPPLSEQRAIAAVLGALDDKIELNRRMNETLEAMAWALFQNWFVEATQSALPKGWRESTIGAELPTLLGGTPSRAEPNYWGGGTIPWINSGKANEFRVTEPSEYITKAGLDNSSTKLLPERTTIIAITGATLGQVSLLEIEACANQSIVGVLGTEHLPSEFIYFWVKENIEDLISWQTGGAQQHINKDNVNALRILCPPDDAMRAYVGAVRPLFDLIKNNCFESRTLAAMRDALLPKLLSGELRVKDIHA